MTAGNASGVNDGAACVLITNREFADTHGLKPLARNWHCKCRVEPKYMGIGPVPAVQKILKQTGLTLDQMDVIELNEAFAAQSLACMRELGLKDDDERVNPNGGAIALGHPLGMSGTRLVITATRELKTRWTLCTLHDVCRCWTRCRTDFGKLKLT